MSTTTHASAAVVALQGAAEAAYRPVAVAGRGFAQARTDLARADDVEAALQAMIGVVVAAEAIHKAADQAVKQVKAALAEQITETGAGTVRNERHIAYLQKRSDYLDVPDEAAVPEQFTRRAIDTPALKTALAGGLQVNWARLMPNPEQTLVIRTRKETV
ncbi:MAG TPA: siphovirus Gp157 family protein [Acetobacteraceae bacterium]|jgi:hypothetical protein